MSETQYTALQRLEDIDKGAGDAFSQRLLSVWRQYEGRITDEYINLFPKLAMFDGLPILSDTPDMIMCGHDALSVKVLGSGWADNAEKVRDFLPKEYREIVGKAYYKAATEFTPVFDVVRAELYDTAQRRLSVFYQRLIIPVVTDGGARFTLGYSFSDQTIPVARDVTEDSGNLVSHKPEKPDFANLLFPGA